MGLTSQPNRTVMKHVLLLILVNIVIRTLWLLFMHPPQALDFEWYFTHAVQIAHGQGYRQGSHYTAYWPIGYPYFLSLLFRVTGPSVIAGLIANALMSVVIVLLIYCIAHKLTQKPTIALMSALGYTILPSQIEWNSVLGSEELFTALLLFAMYLYICATSRIRADVSLKSTLLLVGIAGIVLGIACDVRPIPELFPIALWAYEKWVSKRTYVQSTVLTITLYVGLALGVCPVTIRNAIVLHHFILVSTNGGVVLWQGTHADGAYYWSWNPKINPLLAAGSNQYLEGQIGKHVFIQHVIHHPLWTIVHGFCKWFFLYWVDWNVVSVTFASFTKKPIHWLISASSWFDTIIYWLWMMVCVIGGWKGIRRFLGSWKVIAVPLAYIIYNTAVFFFFPAWDRFRYPMMPFFAILFGLGLHVIITRSRRTNLTAIPSQNEAGTHLTT